jgi:hypothetical protein
VLFWEITAVYFKNHTEHINTLCGQNAEFFMLKQEACMVTKFAWLFPCQSDPLTMSVNSSVTAPWGVWYPWWSNMFAHPYLSASSLTWHVPNYTARSLSVCIQTYIKSVTICHWINHGTELSASFEYIKHILLLSSGNQSCPCIKIPSQTSYPSACPTVLHVPSQNVSLGGKGVNPEAIYNIFLI